MARVSRCLCSVAISRHQSKYLPSRLGRRVCSIGFCGGEPADEAWELQTELREELMAALDAALDLLGIAIDEDMMFLKSAWGSRRDVGYS